MVYYTYSAMQSLVVFLLTSTTVLSAPVVESVPGPVQDGSKMITLPIARLRRNQRGLSDHRGKLGKLYSTQTLLSIYLSIKLITHCYK